MQPRVYKMIGAAVIAAAIAMGAALLAPDSWIYAREFRDARDVIKQIEAFRRDRGSLPDQLADIGRTDDEQGPLYYARRAPDHYVVWFSAPTHGFFGTYVYDSETQSWNVGD